MFDKQTLLWIAAAVAAAYYLWPTISGWFSRPAAADVHELVIPSSFRSFETNGTEDAFDALITLRNFYASCGLPDEEISRLLEPQLPQLLRTPMPTVASRRALPAPLPPAPAVD